MRAHVDPERTYRLGGAAVPGEVRFQVVVEETDLLVVANADYSARVQALILALRGQIRSAGELFPGFLTSFSPVPVNGAAPAVVREMARAAEAVGVGPMAAVAGAIAQAVAEDLAGESPDCLVENGGDLYCRSGRERIIGLLPEPEAGLALGIRVPAGEFPVSFCASSGTIGHSHSFGRGDLAVLRAGNAALADAAATAAANMLRRHQDLDRLLRQAKAWQALGIEGLFAQCQGRMALWGKMELTALQRILGGKPFRLAAGRRMRLESAETETRT